MNYKLKGLIKVKKAVKTKKVVTKKIAKKKATKTTSGRATGSAKSSTPKEAVKKKPARASKAAPRSGTGRKRGLTPKQCEDLRTLLVGMRERLEGQIEALRGESLKRDDEVNSVEDGTDAFDRQFALELASNEYEAVFEIDDALRRLEEGSYGACESCACTIEVPRLKALPFVRNCIACQSEVEKRRGLFRPDLSLMQE